MDRRPGDQLIHAHDRASVTKLRPNKRETFGNCIDVQNGVKPLRSRLPLWTVASPDFRALRAVSVPLVLLAVVVVLHLPGLSNRVFNNDEAYIGDRRRRAGSTAASFFPSTSSTASHPGALPLPLAGRADREHRRCGSHGWPGWWPTAWRQCWCGCSPAAAWCPPSPRCRRAAAITSATVTPGDAKVGPVHGVHDAVRRRRGRARRPAPLRRLGPTRSVPAR